MGDKRWTKAYKAEIRDSRVGSTITLSRALARLQVQPAVLVNGSAIGYYGSRGDERLTEDSAPGQGFLAEVVQDWEAATAPASQAGIRVVHARTGLVVSDSGGAFGRLLPIFGYGLGGRVGSGSQYWSFISLRDEVRALERCLTDATLAGPVNLVAPHAITNREATAAIAQEVRRPAFLPVPALALKAVLGEFADDILASQNVVPQRLADAGFTWQDPTIGVPWPRPGSDPEVRAMTPAQPRTRTPPSIGIPSTAATSSQTALPGRLCRGFACAQATRRAGRVGDVSHCQGDPTTPGMVRGRSPDSGAGKGRGRATAAAGELLVGDRWGRAMSVLS